MPQEKDPKPASEPSSTQADPVPDAPAERPAEVADETWEEKEDKQNSEPDRSKAAPEPTGQTYQYKEGRQRPLLLDACSFLTSTLSKFHTVGTRRILSAVFIAKKLLLPHLRHVYTAFTVLVCLSEQWKPIDPEEKKRYDREFLLRCQFITASMHKPEGLPSISDVVLDKVSVGLMSFVFDCNHHASKWLFRKESGVSLHFFLPVNE